MNNLFHLRNRLLYGCHVDDIDNVNRLFIKYQMSDMAYSQRQRTLKEYLEKNKLGKYSEDYRNVQSTVNKNKKERRRLFALNHMKLKTIEVGMQVQVKEPMLAVRCGEVVYIGVVRGVLGEFIGVVFDGPFGDSNGCDGIIRYFEAKKKCASFVRPEYVEIINGKLAISDEKK